MNKKSRKVDYENGHELFEDSFQVASMSDCTGLIPTIPETDIEINSYSQIYDIPLPNHKNDRRNTMNDQNKNNQNKNNQNKNNQYKNEQNKNDQNRNSDSNDKNYDD